MGIFKIIAGIGILVILLLLYPMFVQFGNWWNAIAVSISPLDTATTMFFQWLPLILLGIVVFAGYKAITGNWRFH
jgi:cytochrome b561